MHRPDELLRSRQLRVHGRGAWAESAASPQTFPIVELRVVATYIPSGGCHGALLATVKRSRKVYGAIHCQPEVFHVILEQVLFGIHCGIRHLVRVGVAFPETMAEPWGANLARQNTAGGPQLVHTLLQYPHPGCVVRGSDGSA